MGGLESLAERSPAEYFQSVAGTEQFVLTSVWKDLRDDGLIDSHHENVLLDQLFDVFDVAVAHGIRSLVIDVFQEVCLVFSTDYAAVCN